MYTSALKTLSSIERSVILEVTGYRAPTTGLLPVFEGLCVLFDRPSTWEDCQQLMISHNFYESLRFFDKDSVSMKKLHKLEKLLADQKKLSLQTMAKVHVHVQLCTCYLRSCTCTCTANIVDLMYMYTFRS